MPFVCWVLLTAGWALYDANVKFAVLTMLAQTLLLLFYVNTMRVGRTGRQSSMVRWLLNSLIAFFILLQLISIEYYLVQGFPLDPFFAIDSYDEVIPTFFQTFNWLVLFTCTLLTLMVCAACSWGMIRFKRRFVHRPGKKTVLLWGAPLLGLFAIGVHSPMVLLKSSLPLLRSSRMNEEINEGLPPELKGKLKDDVGAITRQFDTFHSAEGDSIFILQLESGNAMALNGAGLRGNYGPQDLMPQMYGAHVNGVMAPHMWGASMQTHRGQGTILCSSILDRYAGISNSDVLPTGCLPEKLKADGYYTFFASAYPSPYFAQTGRFMEAIGFDDLHFADKMHEDDLQHPWGYDDCFFFTRYFDYMERHHTELMKHRFLGFFSVVGNHDPFNRKGHYAEFEPFPDPKGFPQRYLDSASAQDHCIATFLKRVEPYREHAHVIVVADHSWPIGIDGSTTSESGATTDNFMIPFLYLPPHDKEEQYRHNAIITTPILGQEDIYPTILELLSGQHYENSFAPLLKQGPDGQPLKLASDYDDCQVMTQPYDGTQVAVAVGLDKITYDLSTRKITKSKIQPDFTEVKERAARKGHVKNTSTFGQFLAKNLCKRYRYWEPSGASKAVPIETDKWVF